MGRVVGVVVRGEVNDVVRVGEMKEVGMRGVKGGGV